MHLTPEEKAIGKENFHGAIGSEFTRRDFLKGASPPAWPSGAGLGAITSATSKVSDPVRVGIIGTGDEGSVLIGAPHARATCRSWPSPTSAPTTSIARSTATTPAPTRCRPPAA